MVILQKINCVSVIVAEQGATEGQNCWLQMAARSRQSKGKYHQYGLLTVVDYRAGKKSLMTLYSD